MPERFIYLEFFIDTNRINSREGLLHMNQLEKWHRSGVIDIAMPIEAFQEAISGRNDQRNAKARSYSRSIVTARMQTKYEFCRQKIGMVQK